MATPNRHMLSLVQFTTWRSELVIAKVIMTARTRRMRVNEADEGPRATSGLWGATTGPQGAVSESLSMVLGLEYHWAPLTGTF